MADREHRECTVGDLVQHEVGEPPDKDAPQTCTNRRTDKGRRVGNRDGFLYTRKERVP
jgi:hypothetical protein